MAARVLVTGAAGALGRSVGVVLSREGAEAHGIDRTVPSVRPRGFAEFSGGDVASLDWPRAVADYDAVFHLAAFVHRRPTEAELHELFEVNLRATERLAKACRDSGSLLVFASTVSVFGRGKTDCPDDRRREPGTDYARSKLMAEDAIREEGARGLKYVILRFPLLYGPYGRGNMERLLRAIARGRYWPFGNQAVPKSCLHFDDASRALVAAWRTPAAHGRAFVVAPSEVPTLGDIHAAAYSAAGRRMGRPLPKAPVLAAASVVDIFVAALRHGNRLVSQIETLASPSQHDGSAFASATGFSPNVRLEDGIRATMDWLRSSPGW